MGSVELDQVEYASAAYAGLLLYSMSRERGHREGILNPRLNGLYISQVGQLGERAVAKALDLYWSGAAFTFSAPDLSHNIEVRTTRRVGQGVKVRPADDPAKKVVGVLVEDGREQGPYVILGWIYAGDAKRKAWGRRPYGGPLYYAVPPQALRPIEELKALILHEKITNMESQT